MNYFRYSFFLFILFDEYNELIKNGNYNIIDQLPIDPVHSIKKRLDIFNEDNDQYGEFLDDYF